MTDSGSKNQNAKTASSLSPSATKRLILFLVALAIGISLWTAYAIHQGRQDEDFQEQLRDLRESLEVEEAVDSAL